MGGIQLRVSLDLPTVSSTIHVLQFDNKVDWFFFKIDVKILNTKQF